MISMRIAAIVVAAALVSGTVLTSPGIAYAATLSTAQVFATDDKVSATSTTYIFAFKTASSGSIKRVEITAPAGYGVAGATLTGSSLGLQLGTLTVSGQTMRLTLPFAIPTSAGNQLSLQISGIDNPASAGPHAFDFATKNNAGGTIDSGNAAITLTDSGVAPGSIGTDQIQDGAVTFDKLAADVLAYFTDLIDALRTEFLAAINVESTERQAADVEQENDLADESAARQAADDALDARLDALEGGTDNDSDGFTLAEGDCDDTDADVNPGATEVANGIDDDCDGLVDEGTGGDTVDASGTYSISPVPTHQCAELAGSFLVDFSIDEFVFADDGSTLTVTGGPTPMTGPTASGGIIGVSGTIAGGAGGLTETYSLTGSFDDMDSWTGTYQAVYAGELTLDCTNQSWDVTGERVSPPPAADAFEPNDSLTPTDLGDAVQDVNSISISANMHLTSDEDWYIFDAVEIGGLLLTDDLNIEIALTNIPAGSNYDLFVSCPTCTGSTFASSTNSDNADELISSIFTFDVNGTDDSAAVQIEVRNVSDTASNDEYTLTISVT